MIVYTFNALSTLARTVSSIQLGSLSSSRSEFQNSDSGTIRRQRMTEGRVRFVGNVVRPADGDEVSETASQKSDTRYSPIQPERSVGAIFAQFFV